MLCTFLLSVPHSRGTCLLFSPGIQLRKLNKCLSFLLPSPHSLPPHLIVFEIGSHCVPQLAWNFGICYLDEADLDLRSPSLLLPAVFSVGKDPRAVSQLGHHSISIPFKAL